MKNPEYNARITKIMKIVEVHARYTKIMQKLRTPHENHENNEIHIISFENYIKLKHISEFQMKIIKT